MERTTNLALRRNPSGLGKILHVPKFFLRKQPFANCLQLPSLAARAPLRSAGRRLQMPSPKRAQTSRSNAPARPRPASGQAELAALVREIRDLLRAMEPARTRRPRKRSR